MSSSPQGGPAVPTIRPEYFQNAVSGNAHVGVQIGKNTGTVTVGALPGGAAATEIERLTAAIREAFQRGEVDEGTLMDAEHEIGVTRQALAQPDAGRAVRAMRRLGGMLDGVAGLGGLAGAVIAAIEGLSS
ncbi:hypothetical protein AB0M02_27825 [Actinoplanes sp. NPDC051861]|uniref:hypothetical protein n=1 Tax=Actinoplanes sp. NPDC051861 TaxID=3155170 RepID=UPI0034325CAB